MTNVQKEKLQKIGIRILDSSRSEIYMNMRFFGLALGGLDYQENWNVPLAATDGFSLFYNPAVLADLYCQSRNAVNRMYLHMILHCVLRHLVKYETRDTHIWNIACDIAVESIIDGLNIRVLYREKSWFRREIYSTLKEKMPTLTAQGIYRELICKDKIELEKIAQEFFCDNHELWYPKENRKRQIALCERKWGEIGEKTETEIEMFAPTGGDGTGDVTGQLHFANRPRYSYKDFLRKFSVLKEEMHLDTDSYDMTFYTYGLQFYGNMPLIEPLESKEVQKIEEFAIVLDTSRSCSGELIRSFLEQTYSILKINEGFFKKVNIHVIQCDERVQSDITLYSLNDIEKYADSFEICGGGGTDFRPAFAYVNSMLENGTFKNLRGLLYFTDGYGEYPAKRTKYDTAFVFVRQDGAEDVAVPPWAMKIILEPDEIIPQKNH